MQNSLNIDHLFSPMPEKQGYDDAFKKAALLYRFSDSDFDSADEESMLSVKSSSRLLDSAEKVYTLEEKVRNEILAAEIKGNTIKDTIRRLNINSDLSNVIEKVIDNPRVSLQELTTEDIFYLISLGNIHPGGLDAEQLKTELNRRYFFRTFEKNTTGFAGRRSELALLNDYVNWLPSRTLKGMAANFIRNVIKWHDKKPLFIQGVGGVGKSALISKFILEQNIQKGSQRMPFVYIDFDLPGFNIKEPLTLLVECLRQLGIQYNSYREIFDNISSMVYDTILKNNKQRKNSPKTAYISSGSNTRDSVFNAINKIISQYGNKLADINVPVLLVLDSFEEMQFRSSREELNNFMSFIRQLTENLPRIRLVLSGRAELNTRMDDYDFQVYNLTSFDREAAIALIRNTGISSDEIANKIYDQFGGTPLMLHLAANMVKANPESLNDFAEVKKQKNEYLVKRILEHIHSEEVRKLAVPGMLVRRINADIIKNVLAKPCGLGEITDSHAQQLFMELKKETMLVSVASESDEIVFRQDLRQACEALIREYYIPQSRQISFLVLNYYKERMDENAVAEAEYYYHLLKRGSIPSELNQRLFYKIREYLGYGMQEFPVNVQAYLSTLERSKASDIVVQSMSDAEWENYYLTLLKSALNGDLSYLKVLNDEIEAGSNRSLSNSSEFIIYAALLKQRLWQPEISNDLIDHHLKKYETDDNIKDWLLFVKAQNLEYLNRIYQAYELTERLFDKTDNLPFEIRSPVQFLYKRLCARLGRPENADNIDFSIQEYVRFENEFDHLEIEVSNDFQYTNWDYLLSNSAGANVVFDSLVAFTTKERQIADTVNRLKLSSNADAHKFDKLEVISNHYLGVYTQSLALTGVSDILLRDLLYALELKRINIEISDIEALFKIS